MPIVVVGLSHHTAPVTVRERFSFPEAAIPQALQKLRDTGSVHEAVILSTCNRVELYAVTDLDDAGSFSVLREFLHGYHGMEDNRDESVYSFSEPFSLEHLFKVASGLDSMVLGETEILGQLKKAYQLALAHKQTGGRLNKTFQKAFNVAKQLRTDTSIQRGSVSVSSVAVELSEKIFNTLADRTVLVIGAGDTSEKAARALVSRGVTDIVVTNRSFERSEALAKDLGGRALPFDQWDTEFDRIDIAISSTSAPHYLLDRNKLLPMMKRRRNRPLLLIDIAVPRDIDPDVNYMDNVYLYNVDDLQSIANGYMKQREEESARCEGIIREKARGLLAAFPRISTPHR
jgi:glutamyl-tRNA reductase